MTERGVPHGKDASCTHVRAALEGGEPARAHERDPASGEAPTRTWSHHFARGRGLKPRGCVDEGDDVLLDRAVRTPGQHSWRNSLGGEIGSVVSGAEASVGQAVQDLHLVVGRGVGDDLLLENRSIWASGSTYVPSPRRVLGGHHHDGLRHAVHHPAFEVCRSCIASSIADWVFAEER